MPNRLSDAEIEERILALLAVKPMQQVDIWDAFPIDCYYDALRVVRAMDARGLVVRERCGRTKLVRLAERK